MYRYTFYSYNGIIDSPVNADNYRVESTGHLTFLDESDRIVGSVAPGWSTVFRVDSVEEQE